MLSRDERTEMSSNKNIFKLTLSDAEIDDEGFYKCIVGNEAGKTEYEFELIVEGEDQVVAKLFTQAKLLINFS